jgi:hypothetical protein
MGTDVALGDMFIGCDAHNEDVALALGVDEVSHVARMDDVKDAVTHDHFFIPGS